MSVDRNALQSWVAKQIELSESISVVEGGFESAELPMLTALAGDAGFRQYFAVSTEPRLLAVMAPKTEGLSESAYYFAGLSKKLNSQGVPTPSVIACDPEHNYLLIEHFGDDALLDQLADDTVDTLYAEALSVLLRIQQVPRDVVEVADYDELLLRKELELLRHWFIGEMLGYVLSEQENQLLDDAFDFLIQQACSQPQVLVHRDYHSRNLMCREGQMPGVIDFQDAVWGPITYDLVSLLRDCYIRWSPEQVQRWALSYGNMAYDSGCLPEVSGRQFLQWFNMMGLQRHIKVLGIFARLSLRDGKHGYLEDLPLVIRYVLEGAHACSETQAFAEWFECTLLPLAEERSWYQDYKVAGDRA